jgi:hypothetical protein
VGRRSNRYYCRLEFQDHKVFDLYCDASTTELPVSPCWLSNPNE